MTIGFPCCPVSSAAFRNKQNHGYFRPDYVPLADASRGDWHLQHYSPSWRLSRLRPVKSHHVSAESDRNMISQCHANPSILPGFVRTKTYDNLAGVLLAVTGCEAMFAK